MTETMDSSGADRRPAANGIQVINRAARILRALRDEPNGLSLGQIAGRVDLPRSTVQRIVNALVAEGLLMTASPTGRVRLGMEILALAASSRIDIVELAHPHLKALSEASGETVDLSVLKKDHLVFVDQVIGSQRLRAVSAVGEVFPLHSTANGKACLALMADEEIALRLSGQTMRLASGRVRPLSDLIHEIAEVRQTGLAYDEEEHSLGISAVGTALNDGLGGICAVSIPVPTSRFAKNRERIASLLLAMRPKLASVIGG